MKEFEKKKIIYKDLKQIDNYKIIINRRQCEHTASEFLRSVVNSESVSIQEDSFPTISVFQSNEERIDILLLQRFNHNV